MLRQAGFLTAPGELNHIGHTLGSLHRALGGTWTPGSQGLTCTDCHAAHGENGEYRNLVLRPGTATEDRRVASVVGQSKDLRKGRVDPVWPQRHRKVRRPGHSLQSATARPLCVWGMVSGLSHRVPTVRASGSWPALDNTPSCMSCHKADGNGNPFGLLCMAGGGQLTENGDSQGKAHADLCHQCHTQGLSERF